MEALFLNIVNMSLTANWLVLAVLLLRLVFQQAPKWISCALWGLVALRLVCPVSIESVLSVVPSSQPLPQEIIYTANPEIHSGISYVDNVVNPMLAESMTPAVGASANPTQIWSFIFSQVWLLGLAVMLLYALTSYLLLKRRMATATILRDNIKQSEFVQSPFVLGFFRPMIYIPYSMEQADMDHVIAHEQAHIRRHDHWWKPIGFLLLSIHWFNPVLWVAYVLLCRDIEAACDEKVIREMERDDRRAYSTALLNCSIHRRRIAACPLAFGEVGVKERVKRVMNYKRPAFWMVFAAVAATVAVAVCFLTDPPKKEGTFDDSAAHVIWNRAEDCDPAQLLALLCQQKLWNDTVEEKVAVSMTKNDTVTAEFEQVPKDAYTLDVAMARRAIVAMRVKDEQALCVEWSYTDKSGNLVERSLYRNKMLTVLALSSNSQIHLPPSSAEDVDLLIDYLNLDDKLFYNIASEDEDQTRHSSKSEIIPLTDEEIEQVNTAFDHYVYDKNGRAVGVKSISCFFTSYYDDVRALNFEEFMRYFPGEGNTASKQEFEALRAVEGWPFAAVATLEQMVVPVHKYPVEKIEQVLNHYAGIGLKDLKTTDVAYLEEFGAFYNYTSDAGSGRFVCTRGEKEGNIVRLYEESDLGTDMLVLRKNGTTYHIVSHQNIGT